MVVADTSRDESAQDGTYWADQDCATGERIIEATYRLIERTGDVDPTMRAILREAGLSTPAFYRHFRSKDELFSVLFADGRRRMAATIERRIARAGNGEQKLREWITAVFAQARDPRAAARTRPFMASIDRLVERYPDEQLASESLLIEQLAGIIDGSADLSSPDARGDATAIYHLAFGSLGWHLRYRSTPRPADVDRVVDFACRALRVTKNQQKGEHNG